MTAEAVLVKDGRIEAVGTRSELDVRLVPDTDIVDLAGRTLLPGFIDAHLHVLPYGESREQVTGFPPEVREIADIRRQVEARTHTLEPGAWILGTGWDQATLRERRTLSRTDFDDITPHHPVLLKRTCGHLAVCNSKALALAGITRETPDPPGGAIERDGTGTPTGILKETAIQAVQRHVPPTGRARMLQVITNVSQDLVRHGITGCCQTSLEVTNGEADAWVEAIERGSFLPRIAFTPWYEAWQSLRSRWGNSEAPLHLRAVKFLTDGSVGGCTAAMFEPFEPSAASTADGSGENRGIFTYEPDELARQFAHVVAAGDNLAVHAMGDRAIHWVLNAMERSGARSRGRHRIEHCSLPTPGDLTRIAEWGVTPVAQTIFMFAEGDAYLSAVGARRSARAYPLRTMCDMGIPIALSSEAPYTTWSDPLDVMLGMRAAATRESVGGNVLGTSERITVPEAIAAYTIHAARACDHDRLAGSIEPGKQADFVVLSDDPRRVPPERLTDVAVEATFVGGEPAYGAV